MFLEETEEALLLGFLFLVVTMALFLMVFVLMVMAVAFLIVVMIVIMAVAFAVVVMLVLMVVMVVFVAEVAVLIDHVCEAVFVAVAVRVVALLTVVVVMVVLVALTVGIIAFLSVLMLVLVAVAVRVVALAVIVVMVVFEAFLVDEVVDSGVVDSMEHLVGELVLVDIEDCAHEVEGHDIAAGKGSVVLDTVVHVDKVEGDSLSLFVDDGGLDVAEETAGLSLHILTDGKERIGEPCLGVGIEVEELAAEACCAAPRLFHGILFVSAHLISS